MPFNASFFEPDLTKAPGPAARSPQELGILAGRNPQQAAAQATHPAPGEEALRVVVPALTKADRHPVTGQFTGRGDLAAGQSTVPGRLGDVLDLQPSPAHGSGGPQNAQFSDPMTRAESSCIGFHELPTSVQVSRLDLRGPAGSLPGVVAVPDPTPVSRPSPCPDPSSDPTSPVLRGKGPLGDALTAHNARTTLFGIDSGSATNAGLYS